jgi:hypothetical protein
LLAAGFAVQLIGSVSRSLEAQPQSRFSDANYHYMSESSALPVQGAFFTQCFLEQSSARLESGIDNGFILPSKTGVANRHLVLMFLGQLAVRSFVASPLWWSWRKAPTA